MPDSAPDMPRQMLPPPTTMAMSIPSSFLTATISRAMELTTAPSMPKPSGPANASPETLSRIRFHDYAAVFDRFDAPNVRMFQEQIEAFKTMLFVARPDEAQTADIDFLLGLGEIFTLVVYAQLYLENAEIYDVPADTVDQVFDVFIRDFSRFAVQLHGKPSTTAEQMEFCMSMIRKPVADATRAERVWSEQVFSLRDAYEMSP